MLTWPREAAISRVEVREVGVQRAMHDLLNELANVRLRETTPGVYRLDHDPDQYDDRAIALGLAANQLLGRPVPQSQPKAGQF